MHQYAQQGKPLPAGPWQDVQASEGVGAWAHRLLTHEKLVGPHGVMFNTKQVFIQGLKPAVHDLLISKCGDELSGLDMAATEAKAKQLEDLLREFPRAHHQGSSAEASVSTRRQSSGGGRVSEAKHSPAHVEVSTDELLRLAQQRGLVLTSAAQSQGQSKLPWCEIHQATTHSTEECRQGPYQQNRGPPPGGRYPGQQQGMGGRPPMGRPQQGRPPPSGYVNTVMARDDRNIQCWGCGEYGHRAHSCPGPQQQWPQHWPPQQGPQQWPQQHGPQQWPQQQGPQQWPQQQGQQQHGPQQGPQQWPEQGQRRPPPHVHPWSQKPTGMMMTQGPGPQGQQGPGANMGPASGGRTAQQQQQPQGQAQWPEQEQMPHMAANNSYEHNGGGRGGRAMSSLPATCPAV